MGRASSASGNEAPSPGQSHGMLAEWLALRGRLTMPQAGRLCGNVMLGDWHALSKARRDYFMAKAQRALVNLSRVMPIYNLCWHGKGDRGRLVRVWYYMGREPLQLLRRDLRRPGCDSD